MVDSQVIAFALVAALLTVTPGVDTMLVLRNVLRGGRRDGIVTTFGICSGLFLHAGLSALGISIILIHSVVAFHVVKIAGAVYLIWLGLQSLAAAFRRGQADTTQSPAPIGVVSTRRCFLEGFLIIGSSDPVLPKSLLLAGIHYAEGILWLATLSVVIDRGRRLFLRSALRRWLDGLCGLALIGLGTRLALERR